MSEEAPRTVIRRDGSATVVRGDGFALDVPEWAVASIQRKAHQDAVLVIERLIAANAGLELNGAEEAMEWAGRSSDPEPQAGLNASEPPPTDACVGCGHAHAPALHFTDDSEGLCRHCSRLPSEHLCSAGDASESGQPPAGASDE